VTEYTPYPKVIFAGVNEYADNTISNIAISLGRRDIYEQANPGIANVRLWTDADTALNVNLSDSVEIQIKDSTNAYQTIYSGFISDLDITLDAYGSEGSIAIYNITAVGPLALVNKHTTGAIGYAKEFDGTRVLNILSDVFLQDWTELPGDLTWSAVSNIATWANWDGSNITLVDNLVADIDTPGTYELEAYSGGLTGALALVQSAAQSGRGFLYEAPDGSLHYDSYGARSAYVPLTLTSDDLLAAGLRQAAQWSEIVNDVTVTYRNGGEAYAADYTSQQSFGQLAGTRSTTLHNSVDAETQATAFLESRAFPRTYPEELTIPMHSPTVGNATRDALISMKVGSAVYTQQLPAVFGTTFDGFVEGMKWQIDRYTADLTLVCSALSETYPHKVWLQIAPTVTWASYTPSTEEWMDL
jgi:hypothetical protein